MSLRKSLISLALSLALFACGPNSKNVKIYYLEPSQGLVRRQENEVRPFSRSRGYYCANPDDFEKVVTCTAAAAKVYYLDPARGLVRKQAGEVRSFASSRGYYCTSPKDAELLLIDCQEATKPKFTVEGETQE